MSRIKRPAADQTRIDILNAAKQQFLKYGFEGASIRHIAENANVHTNLIFHHFSNKETLWVKVKELILAKYNIQPHYQLTSASSFFESILNYRFELFERNPDLVKLIQWQQLTEKETALIGEDISSPLNWLKPIKLFQKKGEIKSAVNPRHIMLFIIFSTHAPFMQQVIPFSAKQKQKYKDMVLQMCLNQFQC